MNEIIPTKELEVYKGQLDTAEKFSTTLEVKTDNDYQGALAEAKHIKEQLEIITARKEAITKPMKASLKSVIDLFKPLEDRGKMFLDTIKLKMKTFMDVKEDKANIKIDKIEASFDAGKISGAVADAKIMMATPAKTVVTEAGKATASKLKKYYVVDKSKIPLQFLEPDMVKIRASFKAGTPVPGVEERLETNISIG